MIGRFIKQEQVRIVKHSSRELKLHLPSTGQSPNDIRLARVIKTNLDKLITDFRPGHVLQSRIYSRIRLKEYTQRNRVRAPDAIKSMMLRDASSP